MGCGAGGFLRAIVGTEFGAGLTDADGAELGILSGGTDEAVLGSLLGISDSFDDGNCEASSLGVLLGCTVAGC
jgi:hypothetical protein